MELYVWFWLGELQDRPNSTRFIFLVFLGVVKQVFPQLSWCYVAITCAMGSGSYGSFQKRDKDEMPSGGCSYNALVTLQKS